MFEILLSSGKGEQLPLTGFGRIDKLGDLGVALGGSSSYVDGNTLFVGSGHHTEGSVAGTVFRQYTLEPFSYIGSTTAGTFSPGFSIGYHVMHNGEFFTFGGITGYDSAGMGGTGLTNRMQRFTKATGARVSTVPGPFSFYGTAAASDGGTDVMIANGTSNNSIRLRPATNDWKAGQNYAGDTRSGQQLFYYDGYFYHFGGWNNDKGGLYLDVYRYNNAAGTWEQTPWMTLPEDKGVVWQGNGYVTGDYYNYINVVNGEMYAQRFHIKTKRFAEPLKLNIPYRNIVSVAPMGNGDMIVSGGTKVPMSSQGYFLKANLLEDVYRIRLAPSIEKNQWTQLADMPAGRRSAVGVESAGKYRVLYGSTGAVVTNTNYSYDPYTNTWSEDAVQGPGRHETAGATIDGKTYIFSGSNSSPDMFAYDPSVNTWSSITDGAMPSWRMGHCMASYGRSLYMFGDSGPTDNALYQYNLDGTGNKWTKPSVSGSTPPPRKNGRMAIAAGKLVLAFGWLNGTTMSRDVHVLDLNTRVWTKLANVPTAIQARVSFGMASVGNKVYIVGGASASQTFSDFWEYDVVANTWKQLPDLPVIGNDISCASVNGMIYVSGGVQPGNVIQKTLYVYNPS
ncbi:virion structural protein [Pseudomonas phage PhiPA3]|uniref:Uncharacterized protein 360 n=1 Tax=Pseudomonas phage PhiPA3 TaxID=998086 RepID=F8SJJ2_BPPA3|nr:virion structural protein [Pseudomonas phage PhiPA3]AEH03783.1 hypothetical protein [Pseudomonas phage PhiPA3]